LKLPEANRQSIQYIMTRARILNTASREKAGPKIIFIGARGAQNIL